MINSPFRTFFWGVTLLFSLAFSCHADEPRPVGTAASEAQEASSREYDLLIKADDVNIGGTLIVPQDLATPFLVIMSSGSGPQDRDETLFNFRIFKVIAEHLASQGIASFRYDDRGVETSTGDFVNSTIDDLTEDVESIMSYFRSDNEHEFDEFILFGHSQGGIVTAKATARNDAVKQLILMGAPAVPLGDLVLSQLRLDYESSGLDASLVESEVSAHAVLMHAINHDKPSDEALNTFKESYRSVLEARDETAKLDEAERENLVTNRAEEHRIVYGLPSLASFVYYDPVNDLKKLKVPVLSLTGARDAQVSIEQNKDRMENALLRAGVPYQFNVFNQANHFFQKADTGLRDEYESLDKEFVDGFLTSISTWILEN
jgi:hypothetical protein